MAEQPSATGLRGDRMGADASSFPAALSPSPVSQPPPPSPFTPPQISLPTGGGAVRGIGEKFTANPATGTGKLVLPLPLSPGRSGFGPQLSLSYDSGNGNGPFGMGSALSSQAITCKTDKGFPKYRHEETAECDVFVLSGAEDLVPALERNKDGEWRHDEFVHEGYHVKRYRPRVEGLFARIERWRRLADGDEHWRTISRDNSLAVYGRDATSRIFDPSNPRHIFSWLICESYDDKGDAVVYEYVAENGDGVDLQRASEQRRVRTANRYLKRIRYGNRQPLLVDARTPGLRRSHLDVQALQCADWMFEVVFDYGEGHYRQDPTDAEGRQWVRCTPVPPPDSHWPVRKDPHSTCRSGFEVRTYRLCQRVLMFHHFPDEAVGPHCLVRSTEFEYRQKPTGSFITRITQCGYTRHSDGRYLRKCMPPLELEYTSNPLEDSGYEHYRVRDLDQTALENLPEGIDAQQYAWVDLYGEGVSGVVNRNGGAWYYKPNAGSGRFGPTELVSPVASIAARGAAARLLDLEGDGCPDLVTLEAEIPGFQERTTENGWGAFRAFRSLPVVDFNARNLRFVDLTGDGIPDILITEDDAITWHPSLLKEGFGPAIRVSVPADECDGPHVIFDDGVQSIYVADMTGDGRSDLVRIRQGEICFWSNQGYGTFGPKIVMDNAPWFEEDDLFDQSRIRLADTDGSGTIDIVYPAADGIRIYLNESGNSWSSARVLREFPAVNKQTSVAVVDLLGRGTACLLWSSTLPADAGRQLRYLDLMDGRKPHLLVSVRNNLGGETRVEYASSTEFYLADKAAGTPWLTRLPFPIHVVKRIETYDYVSRNRFVSSYTYHHGFYDPVEREPRGFARVHQLDTEEFDRHDHSDVFPVGSNVQRASHVPPVLTKTWFHTGVFLGNGRITRHLEHEYYREPVPATSSRIDPLAPMLLDDTILPETETAEETREACRALKGSILRQEVYALDDKEESARPYTVTENNSTIVYVQPRRENLHPVFFTHPRESITFHYERKLYPVDGVLRADPRVSHTITLEVDEYGNVLQSASVGYGRRFADPSLLMNEEDRRKQRQILATCAESRMTNAVIGYVHAYRTPASAEARTYELVNIKPRSRQAQVTNLFRLEELRALIARARDGRDDLRPEDVNGHGALTDAPYRRLLGESRSYYRSDRLDRILPLGELEPLGLPGRNYQLVLTPGLIEGLYRDGASTGDRVAEVQQALRHEGRYEELTRDGRWWAPSGRIFFTASECAPEVEVEQATAHFFLPQRFVDPFQHATTVAYDRHDLMVAQVRDSLDNTISSEHDYRVLMPRRITDANLNSSEVAVDTLGLVVGTAVMGKSDERAGDSLEGFVPDLPERTVLEHLADPLRCPGDILKLATSRIVYDVWAYVRSRDEPQPLPATAYALVRETHASDLATGEQSRIRHSFSYSDGFGREIQKKVEAEPDPRAIERRPRWGSSGCVVFNNKGKPFREYEPRFSATHRFEPDDAFGVSTVLFYDPLQRVIATLRPNHTYEKAVFDPWHQQNWDLNDNILQNNPAEDVDVGEFFEGLAPAEFLPTWYAQRHKGEMGKDEERAAALAAAHARTPSVVHLDSLGRAFLAISHNRREEAGAVKDEFFSTRVELDVQGRQRGVIDALGRRVCEYDYDLGGTRTRSRSIDSGSRWLLKDCAGKLARAWDCRGHSLRYKYDALRRPTELFVRTGGGSERLAERVVYGEGQPDDVARNLRAKTHLQLDGAGIVTNTRYDFKGNLLESTRQLLVDYKTQVNWAESPPLESPVFTVATSYDALNRPTSKTTPDGSVARPKYNEASLLDSLSVEGHEPGPESALEVVENVNYNARGQREWIQYGNGVRTTYEYDPLTFRMTRVVTHRTRDHARLQDLRYIYDPVGNVTSIRDEAQETVFFRNRAVSANCDYVYDALYRLVGADGREHAGAPGRLQAEFDDAGRINLPLPSDGHALCRYRERYRYDPVGNLLQLSHSAGDRHWSRAYLYGLHGSQPADNRLLATRIAQDQESYDYDASGNMTRMPHLSHMEWDFKDQLQASIVQVSSSGRETTYYVYDSAGQRVRKVTERASGSKMLERNYLGSFEVCREYDGVGRTTLERETLHVMDGTRRVLLLETHRIEDGTAVREPIRLQRFQFDNCVGSSVLELDDTARVISYEEYFPFGSTSYEAVDHQIKAARKRYRFTGKERDEETGLYYHGARYYAPWLGRWTNTDPTGLADGINPYAYVHNSPVCGSDPGGTATKKVANVGDVNKHGSQGLRTPNNLESEHIGVFADAREGMRHPVTGNSPIPAGRGSSIDRRITTVALPKQVSDIKTTADMAVHNQAMQEKNAGGITPGTGSQMTTQAGLQRARAAAQQAGTTLPAGAEVAAIGQDDTYHGDPAIRAFSRDPKNPNPLMSGPDPGAEIDAMLEGPASSEGPMISLSASKNPKQTSVYAGNWSEVQEPAAPAPSTPPAPAAPAASAPAAPAAAPPAAETPAAEAPAPAAPAPKAPAPRTTPSGGGGMRMARAVNTAGNVAGNITRAIVPGVAEAEAGLLGAAYYAAGHTATTALVSPLVTASEAVPVVGGAALGGAIVGNVVEGQLAAHGASAAVAEGGGALSAALTGAAVGALIGAPTGIGAPIGAAVGFAAGLAGYYLSKYL